MCYCCSYVIAIVMGYWCTSANGACGVLACRYNINHSLLLFLFFITSVITFLVLVYFPLVLGLMINANHFLQCLFCLRIWRQSFECFSVLVVVLDRTSVSVIMHCSVTLSNVTPSEQLSVLSRHMWRHPCSHMLTCYMGRHLCESFIFCCQLAKCDVVTTDPF